MVTEQHPDPASPDRSQPEYRFDFCGGQLAVDFTNTVGDRDGDAVEHFHTFGDIVAWAEARGVVNHGEAAELRREASAAPEKARRAVRQAIDLREALYAVFNAIADGRRPRATDLDRVNAAVAETYEHAALTPTSAKRFVLQTKPGDGLMRIVRPIVRAAVDLLTSDQVLQVGRCADETCGWVFLDTTRSHTRRWCDMKSCGNRNKVRRFREGAQG